MVLQNVVTRRRLAVGIFVIVCTVVNSWPYMKSLRSVQFTACAGADEVADDATWVFNVENEWLPRSAFRIVNAPQEPMPNSRVRCRDFCRGTNLLSCHVESTGGEQLRLPHYFFPVR